MGSRFENQMMTEMELGMTIDKVFQVFNQTHLQIE